HPVVPVAGGLKVKRRYSVPVLLAILLAALLVLLWQFGGGRKRSPQRLAGSAAGVAANPAKKTAARDFKRLSGYKVTPRADGEKFDAASPPHPLDAEIEARAERHKPWATPVDINYVDTPLA